MTLCGRLHGRSSLANKEMMFGRTCMLHVTVSSKPQKLNSKGKRSCLWYLNFALIRQVRLMRADSRPQKSSMSVAFHFNSPIPIDELHSTPTIMRKWQWTGYHGLDSRR